MEKKSQKGLYYGSISADGSVQNEYFVPDEVVTNGGYVHKSNLEFSRYKQDCRKRALDLAHSRLPHIVQEGDWIPSNKQIEDLADKYYNWLISIPNE